MSQNAALLRRGRDRPALDGGALSRTSAQLLQSSLATRRRSGRSVVGLDRSHRITPPVTHPPLWTSVRAKGVYGKQDNRSLLRRNVRGLPIGLRPMGRHRRKFRGAPYPRGPRGSTAGREPYEKTQGIRPEGIQRRMHRVPTAARRVPQHPWGAGRVSGRSPAERVVAAGRQLFTDMVGLAASAAEINLRRS